MTALDDTRSALGQASHALAVAWTTAQTDAALAAAAGPSISTAAAAAADAIDALDAYEATLPLPLVAGLSTVTRKPSKGVTNLTVSVPWKLLQPVKDGPIVGDPIDQLIAAGYPFRLRLNFGLSAPSWAFTLAGGGVAMNDRQDSHAFTCPKWWVPAYQEAQASFVAALAAKYDGRIPLVFMATNMTGYAEPFMREVGDPATRANLLAAGYTQAADKASYLAMFDMFAAFKRTRVGLSFNPWQFVRPDGTGGSSNTFTFAMIDELRRRFPSGVVQNNSIRTPGLGGQYPAMYAALAGSPPLAFQTSTMPRVGDLPATLQWAVDQGAHLVEMDPGWEPLLTDAQVAQYDAALRANV